MEKNQTLTIGVENAMNAYKGADENGKKMLEALFGKELFETKDIKERVKTFEDACNVLGNDHPFVKAYNLAIDGSEIHSNYNEDVLAYLMLRIIVAALNEGWEPKFTEDEVRWLPWYWLCTKEEWDRLDDGVQKYGRANNWAHRYGSTYAGVVYIGASYSSADSRAYYGSKLALKSEELADYCGKQFADIWITYMFP